MVDEGVEVRDVDASEGAAHREALALETAWRGRDGLHAARSIGDEWRDRPRSSSGFSTEMAGMATSVRTSQSVLSLRSRSATPATTRTMMALSARATLPDPQPRPPATGVYPSSARKLERSREHVGDPEQQDRVMPSDANANNGSVRRTREEEAELKKPRCQAIAVKSPTPCRARRRW